MQFCGNYNARLIALLIIMGFLIVVLIYNNMQRKCWNGKVNTISTWGHAGVMSIREYALVEAMWRVSSAGAYPVGAMMGHPAAGMLLHPRRGKPQKGERR